MKKFKWVPPVIFYGGACVAAVLYSDGHKLLAYLLGIALIVYAIWNYGRKK